jgi:hypothetical protein
MISRSPSKRSEAGLGLLSVIFLLTTLTIAVGVSLVMLQPANSADAAAKTMSQIDAVAAGIIRYRSFSGANPANIDALITPPALGAPCTADVNPASPTFRQLRGWCGPHVQVDLPNSFKMDGWGIAMQYNGTQLKSCGPDRTCGTGDDIVSTP